MKEKIILSYDKKALQCYSLDKQEKVDIFIINKQMDLINALIKINQNYEIVMYVDEKKYSYCFSRFLKIGDNFFKEIPNEFDLGLDEYSSKEFRYYKDIVIELIKNKTFTMDEILKKINKIEDLIFLISGIMLNGYEIRLKNEE